LTGDLKIAVTSDERIGCHRFEDIEEVIEVEDLGKLLRLSEREYHGRLDESELRERL